MDTELIGSKFDEIVYIMDQQAQAEMVKQAAKKYYRKSIADGKKLPPILQIAVSRFGKEAFIKEETQKNKDWFITISAKDNIDVVKFFAQMKKCISKDLLKGKGDYVLEQRASGDDKPYGFHIHWRVSFDVYYAKSRYVQQIYQCFKNYVAASNYIDFKYFNDNQPAYMRGQKKEADKMAKVEVDKLIRKRYNVPEIISY